MVGARHGIVDDLHPLWNGCRAVLHRTNPYREEITEQNEMKALGSRAGQVSGGLERQFAYPVFAAFSLLPLDLIPFSVADAVYPIIVAACALMYVGWLRGVWDRRTFLYIAFFFASYPVIYCLQSRQPTLLFFALALLAYVLLRNENPVFAGVLAALSLAKPQVSLPILLPLMVFAIQKRRSFLTSFIVSLLGLCAISSVLVPGWVFEWIGAVGRYSREVDAPIVTVLLGRAAPAVSGAIFFLLLVTLWVRRNEPFLFQMSLCVIVFRLITPNQFYNSVLLVVPVVWAFDNAASIPPLLVTFLRFSLIEYWVATAVAATLLAINHGTALAWALPGAMLAPILICCTAAVLYEALRTVLRGGGTNESFAVGTGR